MRESGRCVARVLAAVRSLVAPGVSTMDLEVVADKMIREAGGKAAFKGLLRPRSGQALPGGSMHLVNEEIVHRHSSKKRILKEGDIVKVDCGVLLDGYYGDSATTIAVGEIAPATERLMKLPARRSTSPSTRWLTGVVFSDVCGAVQKHVEASAMP